MPLAATPAATKFRRDRGNSVSDMNCVPFVLLRPRRTGGAFEPVPPKIFQP
jgi:hypothetical protein